MKTTHVHFFSSEKIIKIIEENINPDRRNNLMDATSKIVPVGCFSQILIIYVEYLNQAFEFNSMNCCAFFLIVISVHVILGIPIYLRANELVLYIQRCLNILKIIFASSILLDS